MSGRVSGNTSRNREIGLAFAPDIFLSLEPYYVPSERFLLPIWEFASQLETIQRYFVYTDAHIHEYLVSANSHLDGVLYEDAVRTDEKYFKEFHYCGILCQINAVFENFLDKMARKVADDIDIVSTFSEEDGTPYVIKCINFLSITCNLPCNLSQSELQKLNHISRIQTEHIRNFGNPLPESAARAFDDFPVDIDDQIFQVDYNFIDYVFTLVAKVATKISQAYWEFHGLE